MKQISYDDKKIMNLFTKPIIKMNLRYKIIRLIDGRYGFFNISQNNV